MRYYRIEITDASGSTPLADDGTPIGPFDSVDSPGSALHIDFDALIMGVDVVSSGTVLSIHGLPITMLRQSTYLNGCRLDMYGGFDDGLPLANKKQQGLLYSGNIYSAYGNWQWTDQSLNFVLNPEIPPQKGGPNRAVTIEGKKGQKLSSILLIALVNAYPDYEILMNISDDLVLPEDNPGIYPRLSQLATLLRSWSKNVIGRSDYFGIHIVIQQKTIRVFDGSGSNDQSIQIMPQELLGQPTWIEFGVVAFKCPMRSDIHCGDVITLPENIISGPASLLAVNTTASSAGIRDKVNFFGDFQIRSVRHTGSFLNPDGTNAWVTNFQAIALREGVL